MTTSMEPTIANISANKCPRLISGKIDKLQKLGARLLHRKGMSDFPSDRKKKPSSPLGFSALTYRSVALGRIFFGTNSRGSKVFVL